MRVTPIKPDAAKPGPTPLAAWFALIIVSIAVLYAVIDRQVLILLAQPLKADLLLSDTQIGSLQSIGAVLFASIAVIPLGWLADRMDRRLLLALCIIVWSLAVASCGLATGYWTLLMSVALLGAGEAGLSPIVFAMIPDLFSERRRIMANFIFYTATVLGAGVGIAIAGLVVQHIGLLIPFVPESIFTRQSWRLVFFVVAVPGPFIAIAIRMIRINRKPRIAQKAPERERSRKASELRSYLATNWKAIFAVFVPFGMALLAASAIFTWMPVILARKFSLSPGAVGAGLGGALVLGSIAGLAIAAAAAAYLRPKWGALTPVRLSQIGYFCYALITPLYFFARTPGETFLIATIQMGIGVGGNSLMPTLVQDLAPAELRGRFFAISTVVATVFQMVSPVLVGQLSDHVFTYTTGLLTASVIVAFPAMLCAAIVLRLAEKQIFATVENVRAHPIAG